MKRFVLGLLALLLASATAAQELRVFFRDKCPVTEYTPPKPPEESAALAAVGVAIGEKMLTGLINNGVDAVIKSIKPQDKPLSFQSNRDGFFSEGKIEKHLNCLVAVVGKFTDANGVAYPFKAPNAPEGSVRRLASSIPLSESPGFYMEASIAVSPDRTAMAWEPRFVYVGPFLSTNWFAGSTRDIAVTLQFVPPAAASKIGEVTFAFPNVSPGIEREYEALGQATGAWNPVPAEPGDASKRRGKESIDYMPFTLKANYIEKVRPGELASVIFAALDSEKDNLKTALAQEVVPSKKAEEKKASLASARKSVLDYAKLRGDYEKNCSNPLQDSALVECQFQYLDLKDAYSAAVAAKNRFFAVEIDVPALPAAPKAAPAS